MQMTSPERKTVMSTIEGAFTERRGSLKRWLVIQPVIQWVSQCTSVGGKVPDHPFGATHSESGKATGDMDATQDDIAALSRNYWGGYTRTPDTNWYTANSQN
jgi:hypothetical protein